MRILECPLTASAAVAAAFAWFNSVTRRTVKTPDVWLLLRHGGQYCSRWKVVKRAGTRAHALELFDVASAAARWGGVAVVHVHQPTDVVQPVAFFCEPVRKHRK